MKDYILIIGEMVMPDKNAAALRTWALCKSFIDLGYKVVICGKGKNEKGDVLKTEHNFSDYRVYDCLSGDSIVDSFKYSIQKHVYVKIIDQVGVSNIKAIVAQEHEAVSLFRIAKYCKKKSIPLIIDTFEWYEKSRFSFPISLFKNFDTFFRMKMLYPRMKNMICISEYLYKYYKKYVKNIIKVPGTIVPQDDKWNCNLNYNINDVFTVGYAGSPGRRGEKERVDWIIQILCELNQEGIPCKGIFIGTNIKKLIDEFRPDLRLLPFYNEVIIYIGFKPNAECLKMISGCDFSIIAREDKRVTRAGFPTKLSESLFCGTPVITTPSSNVSDYIINGMNGFVSTSCTKESLKKAILSAYTFYKNNDMEAMHNDTKSNTQLVYSNFTKDIKSLIEVLEV